MFKVIKSQNEKLNNLTGYKQMPRIAKMFKHRLK